MPSKTSLVNVLLLTTKIYVQLQVLFHSSVADIFRNEQKLNICPSGKISSFEDNTVCVIPLDGTCEDNHATKPNSFKCGPGSECFNTTCTCVKDHEAYEDKSGCKLSIGPGPFHTTTMPLIYKGIVSPTEALTASIISNSTKTEDQSGKKTTRKEYNVVAPTTIDATIKLKSTVPTTVLYNDSDVVFSHLSRALISRTGAGSQGGYHKGSYYGNSTHRNNTAISNQRVDFYNAVVFSIISSVVFHQFHF